MILLDSDIFIDILRGHAPTEAWFAALPELPQAPGQVVLELLADRRDKQQVRQVQDLLTDLPIVWPSSAACQTVLDHYPDYRLRFNLEPVDALIAACALERQATLSTFNIKHYRLVPGLDVRLPYVKTPPSTP